MSYHRNSTLPIEFSFAVACCQWAFSGKGCADLKQLGHGINWDLFLATCRRHRIQGLVWHCLNSLTVAVPDKLRQDLAGDARLIAEDGLRKARESAEVLNTFEKTAIPLLFLKGLTVGKLAYGNPFLKSGWDIDLLVLGEAVPAAARELERLGYRLSVPSVPSESKRFERWHAERKESVWKKPNGIFIELHSRLADNKRLVSGLNARSPAQQVEVIAGIHLPTLADDELFSYLCVHGASSAWFRLKWITDLAALVDGHTASEIERLYERSQQLGAGRAVAQALLLANHLYDTPIAERLASKLETWTNRLLAWSALNEMTNLNEPTERRLGTATIHLTQFLLLSGNAFKISELHRQVRVAFASV